MNLGFRNKTNIKLSLLLVTSIFPILSFSQNDDELLIEDIKIEETSNQLCFGFSDIGDSRALEICDALELRENIKARGTSRTMGKKRTGLASRPVCACRNSCHNRGKLTESSFSSNPS